MERLSLNIFKLDFAMLFALDIFETRGLERKPFVHKMFFFSF